MAAQGRGLDVYISSSLITSMRFAGPSVTYHLSKTTPGINQAAAVYRGFERSLWNIHEALNILEVKKIGDNQMEKVIFQLRTGTMGGAVWKDKEWTKAANHCKRGTGEQPTSRPLACLLSKYVNNGTVQ